MGVALIMQGVKSAIGLGQMIAGGITLRKANRNRPQYEIPQEYMNNVNLAGNLMNLGMPREQYLNALTGIQRNQNFGLSALQDRRSGLAGIGNLVQQSNDATLKLDATDANMLRDSQFRGGSMKISANYQLGMQRLAKQQWDKFNPFLAKVAQGQALLGAGLKDLTGGMDGASTIGLIREFGIGGNNNGAGGLTKEQINLLTGSN